MIYQSLPYTPVHVKKSFLMGPENFNYGQDETIPGILVGMKAVFRAPPLFEVYLPEYGACYDKTLQCAIFNKEQTPKENIELPDVAWWDCISEDIQVYEKTLFRNGLVRMQNKRKRWFEGTYMFTVDFCTTHPGRGVDLSEAVVWSEHKQKNFFFDEETGALVCGPNNKMRYICESLCPAEFKRPFFKVFEGGSWSHEVEEVFFGDSGKDFDYKGVEKKKSK